MEPTGQIPTFASLDRIMKQIAGLRSRLQPIIRNLPTSLKENSGSDTELAARLHEIEDSLSSLNEALVL